MFVKIIIIFSLFIANINTLSPANCLIKDVKLNEEIECLINEDSDRMGEKITGSLLHNMTYIKNNEFLCDISGMDLLPPNTAVIIKRGGCTFYQKASNAMNLGASAVIIINSVESYYNTTNLMINNPCDLRCDDGKSDTDNYNTDLVFSGYPDSVCSKSSSCRSHVCGLEDKERGVNNRDLCCIEEDYIYLTRCIFNKIIQHQNKRD